MSFDPNVNVNVVLSALSVTTADFGVPLFVGEEASMGAGFVERIRFYTSQDAVTADATDLGVTATAALTAMFSQDLVPSRVAAGRKLTADADYATGLDAILAADSGFFGVAIQSRVEADITSAATWAATNKRLFVAQSSDADVLLAPETDVFGLLKAAGNGYCVPAYHAVDAEFLDCAILGNRLAVNPDRQTTIWAYVPLNGLTSNDLTPTQMTNLEAKNVSTFTDFYGVDVFGMGTVADGTKVDLVLTKEWVKARVEEAIAAHLLSYSQIGRKIPFTDKGINTFRQKTMEVLKLGERVEHFAEDGTACQMPKLADVSSADRTARLLAYTFTAQAAGAIEKTTITGHVTVAA